ncbi:MAG TPA: hypothetical protein VFU47_02175 [Armatimonadota bacterium]|nr:hypothetical protein [Armatimonadota bacterium]
MQLQRRYGPRGLDFVMITQETPEEVRATPGLTEAGVRILTGGDAAFLQYQVQYTPRTLLFDTNGALVKDVEGFNPAAMADIARRLDQMRLASAR